MTIDEVVEAFTREREARPLTFAVWDRGRDGVVVSDPELREYLPLDLWLRNRHPDAPGEALDEAVKIIEREFRVARESTLGPVHRRAKRPLGKADLADLHRRQFDRTIREGYEEP